MDTDHRSADVPVLTERRGKEQSRAGVEPEPVTRLTMALPADERSRLRGHRRSSCGRDLVLQLRRGAALEPGEWLTTADGAVRVKVEAAPEPLLVVKAKTPVDLLQAAYHLGNRHVALQVGIQELRLLEDPVLADLLRLRGLQVERVVAPFLPEAGAYGNHAGAHGDAHQHGHE